jgi:hypothetical protein
MADWTYSYRKEQIPGPVAGGVITIHTPGKMIANAITELQERVITDVQVTAGDQTSARIEANTLYLEIAASDVTGSATTSGYTGSISQVTGVRYSESDSAFQVQTTTMTYTNGVLASVTVGEWTNILVLEEFTC